MPTGNSLLTISISLLTKIFNEVTYFSVLVTAKSNFIFLLFWLLSNLHRRRRRTSLSSFS